VAILWGRFAKRPDKEFSHDGKNSALKATRAASAAGGGLARLSCLKVCFAQKERIGD